MKKLYPQTDVFKKDGLSESKHQQILFQWSDLMVKTGKYPELRWLHSIPNAPKLGATSDNKTRAIRGAQMNREGRKKGVSDIFLPVRRGSFSGLYIELKVPGNKPTREQLEFGCFVAEQGFFFCVCEGWVAAQDMVVGYLENRL